MISSRQTGSIELVLDLAIAELRELRAELVASDFLQPANGDDEKAMANSHSFADDLSPDDTLDTYAACERFGYPQDSIRKWCRPERLGVMQGGRRLVSVPRLQRRINGR
jgi:hypothetical protein